MTDAWETIERPPLPEPFDVREEPLVGVYVESRTIRVKDNYNKGADGKTDATVHIFHYLDATGKLVSVYGKPDLDGKIAQLNAGDLARIEFLGYEEIGQGRKLAMFDVKRAANANAADSSPGASATGTDEDIPF